jgi:peptidoglycan/xylan/chitin deacetylase (PgdA/CDA1 family)
VRDLRSQHWRGILKNTLAAGIWRAHARLATPRARALVVGYHRVVDNFDAVARTDMPTLLISRFMFERHIETIGHSFRFVTLDEIGRHVESGEPFRSSVAAITFDDGYQDVYEHAFPILRRKGIPGAVFVVTNHIGAPCWQTHDRLYDLMARAFSTWENPRRGLTCLLRDVGISDERALSEREHTASPYAAVSALLPALSASDVRQLIAGLHARVGMGSAQPPLPLTWPMLEEMRRHDITIGSHTKTHAWLAQEPTACAEEEVAGSKEALESRLAERIDHFAYPGGQFTPPVVDAVARAGYRFGYTACRHVDPARPSLTIERMLLWERSSIDGHSAFSPSILNCQAHRLWPTSRRCGRVHSV